MTKVVYGSSTDSDLLYQFPEWVADPTLFIEHNGEKHIFLDQREYDIALELGKDDLHVDRVEPLMKEARELAVDGPFMGKVMLIALKNFGARSVIVSNKFPFSMGDFLKNQGIEVITEAQLFPERRSKNMWEIACIEEVQRSTEKAFALIEQILRESTVGEGNVLIHNEKPVTSEHLKKVVTLMLVSEDIFPSEGIIVSHGAQAAIPHHSGAGEIKAGEAIVCDIFPRSMKHYYFADMTRTFCKGEAHPKLLKMYEAVRDAQELACQMVGPGVNGRIIHEKCIEVFESYGFQTTATEGFVHSTGHGVGLDIHECPPRISRGDCILEPGDVVTVEPGLYYPEWGGVRIEDMVYVKEDDARNLTNYPKELLIP